MKKEISRFEQARFFYNESCVPVKSRKPLYTIEGEEGTSTEVISLNTIIRDLFISRQEDLDINFSYKDPIVEEFLGSLTKEEKRNLIQELIFTYGKKTVPERKKFISILDYGRSKEIEKSPRSDDRTGSSISRP